MEDLSTGHAKAILGLKSKKDMLEFASEAVLLGFSVRQLEKKIQLHLEPRPADKKKDVLQQDPDLIAALDSLRKRFSTKVKCVPRSKGGGKLVLEYYNEDDLIRLLELLGG